MWEGEEACQPAEPFFRSACSLEPPRGAAIMNHALQEVETLQTLVNGSLGGAMASVQEGGVSGPVCLPRRAETFGGFDSHQMTCSKNGDKEESEDMGDLRRTESDSVLKKGGNTNLLLLLKRNSEQVLHSVSSLHLLLSTLQAVVVQQDSLMEEQRQALSDRPTPTSRPGSLSDRPPPSRPGSLSERPLPSRPGSLAEQEKQRSLEKQRQELASLQRQQSAHAEERRRRERACQQREQQLTDREVLLRTQEEEMWSLRHALDEEKQDLQSKKEEYQRDLERLRDAQRRMEKDRLAMQRQLDKMEELHLAERTSSSMSDDAQSVELEARLQPQQTKPRKSLNPFTSSSGLKGGDAPNQIPNSLLQLTGKHKGKDRKEKKKKGKGSKTAEPQHLLEPPLDGEIFFC